MNTFAAVCFAPGMENEAIRAAATLRRSGIAVETTFGGKLQKQFDKARKAGANRILSIETPEACRYWRSYAPTVTEPLREVLHYELWLADDQDVLDEPLDSLICPDNTMSKAV